MKTLLLTLISVLALNSYAQNVNIPDANFKAYLVGNTLINTNGDTEIQVSEANAFADTINCSSQNISDLTGIEAFTNLVNLQFWDSNLSYLDLSQNVALLDLGLGFGSSSQNKLDLSQCINLQTIWMECAPFECINVQNTNLNQFYICSGPICIQVDDDQNTSYILDDWGNVTVSESCDCFTSSLTELSNTPKQLLKIVDLIGRETTFKPNTPLIYIYSDGTTEKVFKMD